MIAMKKIESLNEQWALTMFVMHNANLAKVDHGLPDPVFREVAVEMLDKYFAMIDLLLIDLPPCIVV